MWVDVFADMSQEEPKRKEDNGTGVLLDLTEVEHHYTNTSRANKWRRLKTWWVQYTVQVSNPDWQRAKILHISASTSIHIQHMKGKRGPWWNKQSSSDGHEAEQSNETSQWVSSPTEIGPLTLLNHDWLPLLRPSSTQRFISITPPIPPYVPASVKWAMPPLMWLSVAAVAGWSWGNRSNIRRVGQIPMPPMADYWCLWLFYVEKISLKYYSRCISIKLLCAE